MTSLCWFMKVQGPGQFEGKLPVAPPRRPFFGDVPGQMRSQWESFFNNVTVLAFPTPVQAAIIPDVDEKALVYRAPFSSQPGVKPRLDVPADFPLDPPNSTVPLDRVIDLTSRLKPDGSLDWQIPEGKWTLLRFVSRNNGASTRPAPEPGIGFECDKFDAKALDAHFKEYVGKLLTKVGPRRHNAGWTLLHIDSWEMGAQNWSPKLRQELKKRRGYDPQPFYPCYLGYVVGSRQQSERFLWDLRLTGHELVDQKILVEGAAEDLEQRPIQAEQPEVEEDDLDGDIAHRTPPAGAVPQADLPAAPPHLSRAPLGARRWRLGCARHGGYC